MKVFILTIGTQGDFELFLTLGRVLLRRGHHVVLGTCAFYAERTITSGIEWVQLGNGTKDEMFSVLRSLSSEHDRTKRTYLYYTRWLKPQLSHSLDRITAIGAGSDYFISNLKMMLQRNDGVIPGAFVTYDPPCSPADLARLSGKEQEGRILDLVALNKKLLDPQDLWGERFRFTGFWSDDLQTDSKPDENLVAFMHQGPPPVVITMGSMVMFDQDMLIGNITRALQLSGQRGIIVGGWSARSSARPPSDMLFHAAEVPYGWLFPKASCVIHHGGTGTVAAVLGAAKPSILLPQISCQEHFGRILMKEDLATGMFDVHTLEPRDLAAAIRRAVADQQVQQSVRDWQRVIQEDGGADAAADLIEAHGSQVRYN